MKSQRESLQQRLAQRRKRATSKQAFNNSMVAHHTSGLGSLTANLGNHKQFAGSVVKTSDPQKQFTDNKQDYVKKIISESQRGFGKLSEKHSATPKNKGIN